MSPYAELHATSNFSFLRGASHAWELMATADALGVTALGICDSNTLAGVVRPWMAAKDQRLKTRPLTGCRLDFVDGTPSLLVYPRDREAYGRLTRLLTIGQRRSKKGDCDLSGRDFLDHAQGQLALIVPPSTLDAAFEADLARLRGELGEAVWLTAARGYQARDAERLHRLDQLASGFKTPLVAVGDVLYHAADRRPLQDVLTAIREGCTVQEAGFRLEANAERRLKSPAEMARLFARWPHAIERTGEIAGLIEFDLSQLKYEYPDEPVPPGKTAMQHLRDLAYEGLPWRYPNGAPARVTRLIEYELKLIEELDYPNYFLTVHDIVRWARGQGILCQGRGSAANSAVCYLLGVTSADPFEHNLLFARFLSKERSEPPDIDVDFEHERREEVMQYIFNRYGRERAAICATVIHYRPRMAIRQVGKALGLSEDVTALLAKTVWGHWGTELPETQVREAGLDPESPDIKRAVTLAGELIGFPRHLSQHVGGYVLTKRRLDETVPIGNAAMPDRTFIEWDKDDIDALGLMKVDVLALGMLTTIAKGLKLLKAAHGVDIPDLADIPREDPRVYDMLCRADSVGVFQVESRAQMSMLPRLKPREFYDLVIEVAIVRPGPIQGDMVHPYLRRREGRDPVNFPSPSPDHGPPDELSDVLGKTLGVLLFQEQAMRLAIEAAKFTPDEANGLRRAMATFRNYGNLSDYRAKFVGGMTRRGYETDFAERCFKQIEGFGSYGFPESHAISFAILVYASAWLKWAWPDVFCAAILNSQPMGFYQPAQLVRDAREHGVEVRPADILFSDWDCTLEEGGKTLSPSLLPLREKVAPEGRRMRGRAELSAFHIQDSHSEAGATPHPSASPTPSHPARGEGKLKILRLGLREITGFRQDDAMAIMAARAAGARSLADIARAARLSRRALELLAEADALRSLGLDRREGLWAVKGLAAETTAAPAPLHQTLDLFEPHVSLPQMRLPAHVAEDYRTTGLSLKAHPCGFFRAALTKAGCTPAERLKELKDGARVSVAGLVLIRQRPGSARGVVFMTLEDETGVANAVIWADVFQANRRLVMTTSFVIVHGRLQSQSGVIHIVAERFTNLTGRLAEMKAEADAPPPQARQDRPGALVRSRDFH